MSESAGRICRLRDKAADYLGLNSLTEEGAAKTQERWMSHTSTDRYAREEAEVATCGKNMVGAFGGCVLETCNCT
jgi:hypothetical protein